MYILIEIDEPTHDPERINDFIGIIDGITGYMFDNAVTGVIHPEFDNEGNPVLYPNTATTA